MSTPGTQPNQSISNLFNLFVCEGNWSNPPDDYYLEEEFLDWTEQKITAWLDETSFESRIQVINQITKGDSQDAG